MAFSPRKLIVLLGPTASGKTALAVELAALVNAEIMSADSRQVYRRMDLGSGKDLTEYGSVPYHLIDIVEPGSQYNVFSFQRDCLAAMADIDRRGALPLLCGGTGLYLDAILRGYRLVEVPENRQLRRQCAGLSDAELRCRLLELKPEQHNSTNLKERERIIRALEIALGERDNCHEPIPLPPMDTAVFGLRRPREVLRRRIELRLRRRFAAGMIDEVQSLHDSGISWPQLDYYGLEYRLIAWYLQGRLNRNDLEQKLCSAIAQFAKRQDTFFRRMEKNGIRIHWLEGLEAPLPELYRLTTEFLAS